MTQYHDFPDGSYVEYIGADTYRFYSPDGKNVYRSNTPSGTLVSGQVGTSALITAIYKTVDSEHQALRYNEGKTRWSLVDWKSMEPMIQVLEFGATKYEEDNWKKPMDKKQILNSAMRHLIKMMDGEEIDPESGLPHVGHLMCNCMMYSWHTIGKNNLHKSA